MRDRVSLVEDGLVDADHRPAAGFGLQGRPATSERVVDRLPGLRVVADRGLEECHRLLCGVPRVRIRADRVAPKRVAVGNRPDGGLRPIALPPRRPTGAHGVPTGLMPIVTIPPAQGEVLLLPDDLHAQIEPGGLEGRGHRRGVEARVPGVDDVTREEAVRRGPVRAVVIRHPPDGMGRSPIHGRALHEDRPGAVRGHHDGLAVPDLRRGVLHPVPGEDRARLVDDTRPGGTNAAERSLQEVDAAERMRPGIVGERHQRVKGHDLDRDGGVGRRRGGGVCSSRRRVSRVRAGRVVVIRRHEASLHHPRRRRQGDGAGR